MRLSDVVSHSGLAIYAEIALILFVIVFVAIVWHVKRRPRREMEEASRLPLGDDSTPGPGAKP